MQMVGSFAEFERARIRERTQAGLVAARARGRIGGRRPKLGPSQQAEMVDMVQAGGRSQAEAARLFRVHPAAVSRLRTMHRQPAQTKSAELRITKVLQSGRWWSELSWYGPSPVAWWCAGVLCCSPHS